MDDEYDEEEYETYSRKFQPIDLVVLGLSMAHGIACAIARDLQVATSLVAAHANYNIERAAFHDEAMLEIETITGEQDV